MTPTALDRLTTAQVDVQNFALITHAIPAHRLYPHVPQRFELETYESDSGEEMAFISSSTFCNRQIHWSSARYPAHDFDQSTFRTYVTHRDRRGAYFFGTYVSTRLSLAGQFLVAANSHLADFDVTTDMDDSGYRSYRSRARTSDQELYFHIEATEVPEAKGPFVSGNEHAQFITYRLHGFARPPFGGVTYGPIEHRHMDPWSGRLIEGRFDFWERMEVLYPSEFSDPFSVLVEPSVRFTLHPRAPAGS